MDDVGRARAESCLYGLREQIDQLDAAVIGLLADRSYLVGRLRSIKRALEAGLRTSQRCRQPDESTGGS